MSVISSGLVSFSAELGTRLASDTTQVEAGAPAADNSPQAQASAPVSSYKVVSNKEAEKAKTDALYSFRAEMAAAHAQAEQQEQQGKQEKTKSPARSILTLAALAVVLVLLAMMALPMMVSKPKPAALYFDLGNRRFDPSGLGGRLIVRWEGSAKYQLYVDPLDQEQAAGFQTLAVDPPHPLSVMIQLLDASDMPVCQKEIVLPTSGQPGAPVDMTQALMPKTTAGGDLVQDMAGADGQVAEITASGPLPCSLQAYDHLASWRFTTNFPTVADQEGPLKKDVQTAQSTAASRPRARSSAGWRVMPVRFQRLSAPIEGDDVIVGDNPSRGTIDTSDGREFLIGAGSTRTRSAEWQIFPSAIHFRCEKTGTCVLTRISSRSMVQARLVR